MNSINATHFATQDNRTAVLDTALHRLGEWMDVEMELLGRLLTQSGRYPASTALNGLAQLHYEPGSGSAGVRALLEHAQVALGYILEVLLNVSCWQGTMSAWGMPGRECFEAHLRWSAARLMDINATLRYSLKA